MKAVITLFIICLMGVFTSCRGQSKSDLSEKQRTNLTEKTTIDSSKQMNLLDEQVKVFEQVFTLAGAEEENPLNGATNYLELIEKMECSNAQKKELREMYKLYDASLDPKKKEELKTRVNKMIQEAMNKERF